MLIIRPLFQPFFHLVGNLLLHLLCRGLRKGRHKQFVNLYFPVRNKVYNSLDQHSRLT